MAHTSATRQFRRSIAAVLASLLIAGAPAPFALALPALAADAPVLFFDPGSGQAGDEIKVEYFWASCGGLPAGDYTLEIYWETIAGSPLVAQVLAYDGSDECDLAVFVTIPSGAPAGAHDLVGVLVQGKNPPMPASETKGSFLVTAGATQPPKETQPPKATEQPAMTEPPKNTPAPSGANPTPSRPTSTTSPDATVALDSPSASSNAQPPSPPTGSPSGGPGPTGAEPAAGPDVAVGVSVVLGTVSGLLLGGLTQTLVAVSQGMDPLPPPTSRGPNLSHSATPAFDPDVAATSRNVFVTWTGTDTGNPDVMVARSYDHGYTFEPPINLSRSASPSLRPSIVADENHVSVAWEETGNGTSTIVVATSLDEGISWTSHALVAPFGTDLTMATAGGVDYLAWIGSSGELSFSPAAGPVSTVASPAGAPRHPVLSGGANGIALAWETSYGGGTDLAFAVPGVGDQSWRTSLTQTAPGAIPQTCMRSWGNELHPVVARDGDTVVLGVEVVDQFATWIQASGRAGLEMTVAGNSPGQCVAGAYDEREWATRLGLDPPDTNPSRVSVAARGGIWCAAWRRFDDSSRRATLVDVICRSPDPSSVASSTWGLRESGWGNIDRPTVLVAEQPAAFSNTRVAVAWQERTDRSPAHDIWLRFLGGTEQNLSQTSGNSIGPVLASSGGNVTVVWTEASSGSDRQVYVATVPAR